MNVRWPKRYLVKLEAILKTCYCSSFRSDTISTSYIVRFNAVIIRAKIIQSSLENDFRVCVLAVACVVLFSNTPIVRVAYM